MKLNLLVLGLSTIPCRGFIFSVASAAGGCNEKPTLVFLFPGGPGFMLFPVTNIIGLFEVSRTKKQIHCLWMVAITIFARIVYKYTKGYRPGIARAIEVKYLKTGIIIF